MPTATKTGVCSSCSLEVDLKRGKVAAHPAPNGKKGAVCPGAGQPPARVIDADTLPVEPTVVAPTLDQQLLAQARPSGAWSGAEAAIVDPKLCDPDGNNPRRTVGDVGDLALSLVAQGMLEPIIVAPGPTEGRYTIVAGHRRVAAAIAAGLPEVPALIRSDLVPGSNLSLAAQIVENLHRVPLSPLEEAHAFDLLRELGMKQADIAAAVGVNQGQVSKRLALLKLPEELAAQVGDELDVATAVELTRLPAAARDKALADIGRGDNADRAVRAAKAAADRKAAHDAIIDGLEAAGVALVDFPGSWHWGRDREDRPLLTGPDGEIQQYRSARTIEIHYTEHATEPCHGAAVSDRDEVIYVCLDPTRHGYPTVEQEAAALDAERAAADEEQERVRAAAEAADAARHQAARDAALADVKAPYMTDVIASWIVDRLPLFDAPVEAADVLDRVVDWTGLELPTSEAFDDQQVAEAQTEALLEHHGHLRLAYMVAVGDVDLLLDQPPYFRQMVAGTALVREHFNRLTELTGYEPSAADLALVEAPAVGEHPTQLPDEEPPPGAIAWYEPAHDARLEGDEARWIVDSAEFAAIADAGYGLQMVAVEPSALPDPEETKEGNASPSDGLPADPEFDVDDESVAEVLDPPVPAIDEAPPVDDPGEQPMPGERCPASRKAYNLPGSADDLQCPARCGARVSTTPSGRVRDHDVPEVD